MNKQTENKPKVERPVDRLVIWLRWPENKFTGMVPWYVIIWRLLWLAPLYVAIVITTLLIAISYGINSAIRFYQDAI